jgi:hypothetical protein
VVALKWIFNQKKKKVRGRGKREKEGKKERKKKERGGSNNRKFFLHKYKAVTNIGHGGLECLALHLIR